MSNETASSLSNQTYVNDTYETLLQVYTIFGCLTVLTYASALHFADEVEYILKRKFSLPTYLYLFSKYPLFLYFSILLVLDLWPEVGSSLSLCNGLGILAQAMNAFPFIGVQGLISLRTYSLFQGYKPVLLALCITFLAALAIEIYEWAIPACGPTPDFYNSIATIQFIMIILSDALAFIAAIRQAWGLRGLQRNHDLIASILRQGILRFCFVLFITTTVLFVNFFLPDATNYSSLLQNMLSVLLMCELTLDLRRRNTPRSIPNPSDLDLPTFSFQENPVQSVRSVLGRLHESIIAEMGERNDPIVDDLGSRESNSDDLQIA